MSNNIARMIGAALIGLGLIAGSLGVASAGADIVEESNIVTEGGDGGDGGNASVSGGNNTAHIDQGNNQQQNQNAQQTQNVDQDINQNVVQTNHITGNAGGSIGTSCAASQPDGGIEGGAGTVNSGADSAACAVGDSSVGNSATGNRSQANSSSQSASNVATQHMVQNAGNQVNAPVAHLVQSSGNVANAGDGGDGGDATNSGNIEISGDISITLARILDSILSGNDTIIEGGDDDDLEPAMVAF